MFLSRLLWLCFATAFYSSLNPLSSLPGYKPLSMQPHHRCLTKLYKAIAYACSQCSSCHINMTFARIVALTLHLMVATCCENGSFDKNKKKTLALPPLLYFGFMSLTGQDVGFCFGKTHLHVCNISVSLFSAIIVYCCHGNITSQQRVTHPTLQLKSNNCSKCHIKLTTRTLSISCATHSTLGSKSQWYCPFFQIGCCDNWCSKTSEISTLPGVQDLKPQASKISTQQVDVCHIKHTKSLVHFPEVITA